MVKLSISNTKGQILNYFIQKSKFLFIIFFFMYSCDTYSIYTILNYSIGKSGAYKTLALKKRV